MATSKTTKPSQVQATKSFIRQPRFIICMTLVAGILALLVGISIHNRQDCLNIQKNNTAITATVTDIKLYKHARRWQTPPPTNDIGQAQTVHVYVTYTANGITYNEKIPAQYKDGIALGALFGEARTGRLDVRYETDKPSLVRPASEFTSEAIAAHLCEQG